MDAHHACRHLLANRLVSGSEHLVTESRDRRRDLAQIVLWVAVQHPAPPRGSDRYFSKRVGSILPTGT